MIRKVYTFIFAFILNAINLFAQEYSTGDIIEKDEMIQRLQFIEFTSY